MATRSDWLASVVVGGGAWFGADHEAERDAEPARERGLRLRDVARVQFGPDIRRGAADLNGTGINGTLIQGNYIGTDVEGRKAVPNLQAGLWIESPRNTIAMI